MPEKKPGREKRKRKAPASSVSPEENLIAGEAPAGKIPAKDTHGEEPKSNKEKNMPDEYPANEEAAIPPSAEEKVQRAAAHARQAAEDLRSVAGAVAGEYRGKAEEAWQDASNRVRSFQEDTEQYVRENPTKAVCTALGIGFLLGLIFRR